METKGWDVFRVLPPEQDSSSEAMNKRCMAITVRVLKVIAYAICFIIVLGGAVISKTTILFMTSQIRPHKQILHCNKDLERDKQYVAEISSPEQVAWIWCLCCAFLLPELGKASNKMSIGAIFGHKIFFFFFFFLQKISLLRE